MMTSEENARLREEYARLRARVQDLQGIVQGIRGPLEVLKQEVRRNNNAPPMVVKNGMEVEVEPAPISPPEKGERGERDGEGQADYPVQCLAKRGTGTGGDKRKPQEVGVMLDARLGVIEDRLPLEQRLRPPPSA